MSRACWGRVIGALRDDVAQFTIYLQQQGLAISILEVDTFSDLTLALQDHSWDVTTTLQGGLLHNATEELPVIVLHGFKDSAKLLTFGSVCCSLWKCH